MAEVQEYTNMKVDVLGLTVTGMPPECFDELHFTLKNKLGKAGINYLGAFQLENELEFLFAVNFEQIVNGSAHNSTFFCVARKSGLAPVVWPLSRTTTQTSAITAESQGILSHPVG